MKFVLEEAIKFQVASRVLVLLFCNRGARGARVVAANIRSFNPLGRNPYLLCRRFLGPKVGLDGYEKSRPYWYSILGPYSL